MPNNRGKQFETKFKSDFLKSSGTTIDRLVDVMTGYKNITNIADYIAYHYPNIYYIELKSHKGNTFPFSALSQYEKLLAKANENVPGVRVGVIIWFIEHDKICYVPIKTLEKMKLDEKKSVNIKDLSNDRYFIVNIPSTKKRVFMDSDYSVLFNLRDGQ